MHIRDISFKKDPWVKSLNKANTTDEVVDLLKKSIEWSTSVGPFYRADGQISTLDVIADMIGEKGSGRYRSKLTPAIGTLLFRIVKGEMIQPDTIALGLFKIIRRSKITDCMRIHYHWLTEHIDYIKPQSSYKEKEVYNEALMAYSVIQGKSPELETFWYSLWHSVPEMFYLTVFAALFKQNPELAAKEIPKLFQRRPSETYKTIYDLWLSEPKSVEKAVLDGLCKEEKWSGVYVNKLLYSGSTEDKLALFQGMNKIGELKCTN